MTWKDILKNLEMNRDDMCCEEARVKIINWFEKHIDKVDTADMPNYTDFDRKSFKDSLEYTTTVLSEESCEELYDSIERFMENYNLEKSNFFENRELEDIMSDWDKCRKEPTEDKQSKELPPQDLFESNPASWMDEYIRSR
mgnify:CR=1 FL=1